MMNYLFNGHIIKAITIKQPYASMIVNGQKDIENRSWKKKMYKNICKNWLLVHTSSKPVTVMPNSCIIGMMHINCVGKISDVVHSAWAKGPNCWYIDAVIKFKTPISTTGKLGQWNPDPDIHFQLNEQITDSMYNIIPLDNIDFVNKGDIYYAVQRGKYMTWGSVINSLIEKTDTFTYKLIQFLLYVEHESYFWECDQVDMKNPFRFAIFDSKTLAKRKQDDNAFKGAINCSNKLAIAFPSLNTEVILVVPCHKSTADYTSLATFSRTAPINQQVAFWKKVGQNIKEGDWISTSGLGVAWLHVRIAQRPKYYHDAFDKNPPKNTRKSMEEFIDNFKFPQNFVNVIVVGKNWTGVQEHDMIINYLELLPKNTKVICVCKTLQHKIDELKFDTVIYQTDWKKYGRFGKQERNKLILKQHVDLVTIFGNKEDDLADKSNIKGIKTLILKV
jgi:hypothetical protein